jgi:rod shape-determining protein MreB
LLGLAQDIGVDLGTASVIIFVRGRGIVLREPSVVAVDRDSRRILAVGEQARRMLGRTPGNVVATRPLRQGVIADYEITEAMLKHFLAQVCGKRNLFRPRVMVCVPSGVTSVEKRAVMEAAAQAGARATYLIEEPLAAALGAGLDVSRPRGHMVVDIGGGTTDIAVLSLRGVVLSDSTRVGGDYFDDAIVRFVRREHGLMIGERTAEEIKITVGTVAPDGRAAEMEARGRDLVSGLPRTVKLASMDVRAALMEPMTAIIERIHSILERTPPELSGDIVDYGMVLTGGGALLHGVTELLSRETGVPIHLPEDPISCVAMGTGRALEEFDRYSHHFTALKNTAR